MLTSTEGISRKVSVLNPDFSIGVKGIIIFPIHPRAAVDNTAGPQRQMHSLTGGEPCNFSLLSLHSKEMKEPNVSMVVDSLVPMAPQWNRKSPQISVLYSHNMNAFFLFFPFCHTQ